MALLRCFPVGSYAKGPSCARALEMYPNRCVLFGGSDPETILDANPCRARKVERSHWLECVRHRPSRFLQELSQPFCRSNQLDDWEVPDVAEGMWYIDWNMDVIARRRLH